MRRLALVALMFTFVACSSEPETPEAQIRAWVARAETAAENKEGGAVDELVSSRYRDERGLDRRGLKAMLVRHFLANRAIHVWTQIQSIELPENDRAEVVVFVGMAGGPMESIKDIAKLKADLYRFDFELAADSPGLWQLTTADWRPAEMEDL